MYLMHTSVTIMAIYDGRLLGILLDSVSPNLIFRKFRYLPSSLGSLFCPRGLVICPRHPYHPRGPLELLQVTRVHLRFLPPLGQGTPTCAP